MRITNFITKVAAKTDAIVSTSLVVLKAAVMAPVVLVSIAISNPSAIPTLLLAPFHAGPAIADYVAASRGATDGGRNLVLAITLLTFMITFCLLSAWALSTTTILGHIGAGLVAIVASCALSAYVGFEAARTETMGYKPAE